MDVRELLGKLAKGEISVQVAEQELRLYSIEYVEKNLAKIDPLRELRSGIPEVIFGDGKDVKDIRKIVVATVSKKGFAVISKVSPVNMVKICKMLQKEKLTLKKGINTLLVTSKSHKIPKRKGKVGILCAGTSDIKIAEEAEIMAHVMGCDTLVEYDVGIAGIHRTLEAVCNMINSRVHIIIVVAGMEGALGSLVSSLTDIPVIGVPTSIGYGFGANGMTALASMLQTCTMGMTVVNVDNGIGAGAFAAMVANKMTT